MKKTGIIAAAGLAALISSCSSSAPKADMKTDVDSLSYSIGMAQTQGLKPYLVNRLGVDTTYLAEFVKGLNEGANAGDDNYEVIKEGNGEIPADTSRVEVNYEGKLINDTVFDSSYERKSPATFRCNQVIPGWTEALTHMPVGSTWMVYIPQDQAYAEREAGQIKPFSALKFKIELLSIKK